jgi:hypothetical protein
VKWDLKDQLCDGSTCRMSKSRSSVAVTLEISIRARFCPGQELYPAPNYYYQALQSRLKRSTYLHHKSIHIFTSWLKPSVGIEFFCVSAEKSFTPMDHPWIDTNVSLLEISFNSNVRIQLDVTYPFLENSIANLQTSLPNDSAQAMRYSRVEPECFFDLEDISARI